MMLLCVVICHWCYVMLRCFRQDNEDEEEGEDLSFNESQDVARAKMVKTAKKSSKEVEIQVQTTHIQQDYNY